MLLAFLQRKSYSVLLHLSLHPRTKGNTVNISLVHGVEEGTLEYLVLIFHIKI